MKHDRITVDLTVMVGKPVIKGTRIPVEQVLREPGGGWTFDDVIDALPRLTVDDIKAAMAYAADAVSS